MLEPTISLAKAKSFGGDRSAAGRYAAQQRWAGHRKKGDKAVLFDFYEPHFKYPDDFYEEEIAPQKFRELKDALSKVRISDAPAVADVTREDMLALANGTLMKLTNTTRAGFGDDRTREYLIEYMSERIWGMWTSDPNTRLARMVKDSVSKQFGVSWREGVDDRHTKRSIHAGGYGFVEGVEGLRRLIPDAELETFDKIVKAMYEHTQARLAGTGITHVRLFRGTAVPTADLGKGVYRSSPLAGWTIDKKIAEKWQGQAFGNESRTSVIMEAEVPVKQIFWAQGISTGKGHFMEEFEFLTLGGDVPLKSMRKREDWLLQKAKSFGGDRSAAGRYAAEQRWAGHTKKGDAKVVFNPYTQDPAHEGNWFAEIYNIEHKMKTIPALPTVQISEMPAVADLTDADLRTLLQGTLNTVANLSNYGLAVSEMDDGNREEAITAMAIRMINAWKMDPKSKLALLVKDSISRQMSIPWRKGEADRYATEHRGVGRGAGDVYQGVEGLRKIIGPEEIAIFDKIVMAVYQKTQARLAATGITHMRLFRGTAVPPEKFGKPYSSAPLSGWAPMKNTAGGFQGAGNLPNRYWWTPVLMEAEIPVEKIFWAQGWSGIPTNFHSNEEEVIVTGGKIPVQMWTKEQWDKRYDTIKARSFGGDRSAAGRYAANMRWAGHVKTETSADETTGVYDAYVKDEDEPDDFYAERYRTPFWDDIPIQRPPFTAMPAMEGVTVEDVQSLTDGVFRDITLVDAPEQQKEPEQLEKMVDFLAGIFWLQWKNNPSRRLPVLVKDSVARQMDSPWRKGDADTRALREPIDIEGIGTVRGVEGMRKLLPKKDLETFDKIVMAIYQRNQQVMKSLGITHMRLFRGTAVPEDALDTKVYDSAPIAGWSINKEIAKRWEGPESNDAEYTIEGTESVVMEAIVPAKNIFWAESLTAFGTSYLGEREVAVIGPKVPLESIRTNADFHMGKAKSFGGDRSAAGRYAAEQRWAGHAKVAGFTDANGLLDANKLKGIKTRHPKWLELDATANLDGHALYEVFTWFGGAVIPEWAPPNWRRDSEAAAKENPPRDIATPEQKQMMLDEIYDKMVNSWKGTSRSSASVAVRDSLIRQGMGIWRDTKGDKSLRAEIDRIKESKNPELRLIFSGKEQKVFDAIVLGIYQHTQRILQEHGVKELKAFRGTAIEGEDDVSPEQRNTYQAAALSSWSLDRATAQSFVGGHYIDASSVLYAAKIPAEQVFAIEGWTTDNSSGEREVFVIGGKKPFAVKTYGTTELSEEALKAKSFGGDRSAAGRYAAEMRWAGHTKTETSADADGVRISGTVKDPKTTLFGPHHPQAVVMKKWIEGNPRSSMPSAKALTDEELMWVTKWVGIDQYSDSRLKATLADPELRADLIDRLTETLLLMWKVSARTPVSIIVKDSIARQFGAHWRVGENGSEDEELLSGIMPEDDQGNFRLDALKESYGYGASDKDMAQNAVDKLVLSIYEQTQGAMEAAGFTELRAFRGTKNEEIRSEWNAAYTEPASAGRPNPIVVQTGYNGAPVSGWTFWRKVAGEFTVTAKGVMLATTVPRDQVFAIEGFNIEASDYNEDEIWLIGNAFDVSVGVYETDFSGPEFDAVQGTSDSAPIFVFSKASFGGDRSAAGRYAANMRWAGHNKRMDSIVERTIANEGLSVKMLTGEEPKTGFMVAKRGYTMIVRDEDFMDPDKGKAILKKYLKKYGKFLRGEQYLGLWWDKDNKEIVLDVVDQIADRDDAIKAGERENQQYIWDVENAESIYTGGTGDRETEAPDATGQVSKAGGGHDGRRIGRDGGHHLGAVYGGSGRDRELMRLIAKARLEARVRVLKNQPSSSAVHVDAIMQTRAPRKKKKKKKVRNRLLIGDE